MIWLQFATGDGGFLNLQHVVEFEVNTVSGTSHLLQARMVDGSVRSLDTVGYPTAAEALEAIRGIVSGVVDA